MIMFVTVCAGAGKTTTLKMLTGEELPTAGSAKVAGYDIIEQQNKLRSAVGCAHNSIVKLCVVYLVACCER